ncbi:uncharacterized protein METZ01_LOCUS147348 [marine metagenome]|uniref:Pyridoxamine 5'-phosphate oxidase N-terminal domain-containing protein n=1 Tax=marine metagenome TaxID=408172 RepID=A0A381ZZF2_9ZZZZ|tara:strand:+ start:441 stop:854 length:414 start_codon:yes stop_codon:yes gene_type:complete
MVNISSDANTFLTQTQIAVISTVDSDNRPHSVPIWYQWDGDSALMFTGVKTLKWKNLSANPYASLCVDFREPPYRSVVVHGKIQTVEKPIHEFVKNMADRYYGPVEGPEFAALYPDNKKGIVIFRLVPDKIIEELDG